jgi:hypothetical protein
MTDDGPTADGLDEDGLDDDAPLDEAEAADAAAVAGEDTDESLDERIGSVIDGLEDVARTREGEVERLAVGGRVFAVVGADLLEVALDPPVATAALKTPDTRPSPRGAGWIAFTPTTTDRFALDRAEAWVRLAHRRAGGAG